MMRRRPRLDRLSDGLFAVYDQTYYLGQVQRTERGWRILGDLARTFPDKVKAARKLVEMRQQMEAKQ